MPISLSLTRHESAMVLLVDDQTLVAEAVRRALAGLDDIDFHYCSNSNEAVELAVRIKSTVPVIIRIEELVTVLETCGSRNT